MAAQRLGTVLSNLTGTSGQLLRVKANESGFEFFTPAAIPAYTITGDTTDRAIDASNTTTDELANVVATLIHDLTDKAFIAGGGANILSFTSPSYSCTSSEVGVSFSAAHNFGYVPDYIAVQMFIGGQWIALCDYESTTNIGATETHQYGYDVETTSDTNTANVTVYNMRTNDGSTAVAVTTADIRIICFKYNVTGAPPAPFQWSATEQVWPFEKDKNGNTLYCKEVDFGALPNNSYKQVDHGISGWHAQNLFDLTMVAGMDDIFAFSTVFISSDYVSAYVGNTYIQIQGNADRSAASAICRMIYSK